MYRAQGFLNKKNGTIWNPIWLNACHIQLVYTNLHSYKLASQQNAKKPRQCLCTVVMSLSQYLMDPFQALLYPVCPNYYLVWQWDSGESQITPRLAVFIRTLSHVIQGRQGYCHGELWYISLKFSSYSAFWDSCFGGKPLSKPMLNYWQVDLQ